MADISVLARLLNGAIRNVDLSSNSLIIGSLKVGSSTPFELTKVILGRLIDLQDGSDVDVTYHTHDTLYYRKTEINKNTAAAGSTLVGDNNSYTNFTPTAATVKGALAGIDAALGSATNALDSTFRIENTSDITKKIAFDASGITTGTTRTLKMADFNVDLAHLTNANIDAAAAIAYSKLNLSASIVNADIAAGAAIAYSKLNLSASIVNADIAAGAAIAFSKLAALTSAHILIGNGSNVATDTAVSGDISLTNAGVTAIVATTNSSITTLSGLTTATSLASVGTITSGTWNATTIAANHGGTGFSSFTVGDTLYANTTSTLVKLGIGSTGQVLTVSGGVPVWANTSTAALTQNHIFVGNASNVATDVAMSGEATIVASGAVTLSNAAVIAKVLTGYVSGAGTITAADSILTAIEKLEGNDHLYLPLAGGTMSGNIAMGGNKLTGLGAGSTAGDSVRYEQVILVNGTNAFTGDQSMGGFKLTNLADPVASQDAITLSYLNARLNGLKPKQSVRAATTVAGTLATSFANGSVIDGVTLATGNRILIWNQAAPAENGIYTVNASGAPTRAVDFDSLSPIDEINGAWVAVQEGTVNAGKVFVQYGLVSTLGTDAINFEFYNPIAGLIGGDMITFAGSTFSVDLATASGLESTNPGNVAGQLRIKLEASNPSLKFTGSNELAVKLDAAGAILSGASGLAVQVDGSTIEISSNALRVKDAGITLAKLASNSVDENKIVSTTFSSTGAITGGSGTKVAVAVDSTSIEISSNALRIKSTAYDQVTIVGGSGTVASVAAAPALKTSEIAGESLSATTLVALRYAKAADAGFVAGRVYKADYDTTTADNFYVIGLAYPAGSVSAGGAVTLVDMGLINAPSHGFTVGLPLYLTAAGALSTTAPSGSLQAAFKVGMVKDANNIFVQPQLMGVNA